MDEFKMKNRNGIGSLIQILAKSEIDEQINKMATGNISFFESSYNKHYPFYTTNIEHKIPISHDNKLNMDFGNTYTYKLSSHHYDYIGDIFLKVSLPKIGSQWKKNIMANLIESIKFKCGQYTIKTLDSHSLNFILKLNTKSSKQNGLKRMIGAFETNQTMKQISHFDSVFYIPLPFFQHFVPTYFDTNTQDELHIIIKFRKLENITQQINSQHQKFDATLLIDHHKITIDERMKNELLYANFETLISTYPYEEFDVHKDNAMLHMTFKHNVKEFIIIAFKEDDEFTYEKITNLEFYLNGKQFDKRDNIDGAYHKYSSKNLLIPKENIYSYSFSLSPSLFQPTGSLNMNKINNSSFYVKFENEGERKVRIYANTINKCVISPHGHYTLQYL